MTLLTLQNACRGKWCIYLVTQQSGSGLNTSLCLSQVGAFAFGFIAGSRMCEIRFETSRLPLVPEERRQVRRQFLHRTKEVS